MNNAPAGLLTISDPTPTEDQLLTVSIAGVTDADNPGAITGPVSYVWQVDTRGDGVFEDIIQATGLGDVRATGPTFTPGDAEAGLALRAIRAWFGWSLLPSGVANLRAIRMVQVPLVRFRTGSLTNEVRDGTCHGGP